MIPKKLRKLNFWFLNKVNDIRIVNKGIVPIKVEATLLSTYISLKLIKLKGITFPNSAIANNRILFLEIKNLGTWFLQNKKRNIDAINSL